MEIDEYKKCPFCCEQIKAQAIKCRFCHSILSDQEKTDKISIDKNRFFNDAEASLKSINIETTLPAKTSSSINIAPTDVNTIIDNNLMTREEDSSLNDKYTGDFVDGLRHGRGMIAYNNGIKIESDWINDQPFGEGILISPDGTRFHGMWETNSTDVQEGLNNNHNSIPFMLTDTAKRKPWLRYFARLTDYTLFSILIAFTPIFNNLIVNSSEFSLLIGLSFVWIFIEALFLSVWGTTPGKWLLSMRIINADGIKLKFPNALSRSFEVWVKGLGLNIPLVNFFTMLAAYDQLSKKFGNVPWDKKSGYKVIHDDLKPLGICGVVLIHVVLVLGLIL